MKVNGCAYLTLCIPVSFMYVPSVVVAMFNTVTILLPVPAHIDFYLVAVYLLWLNYSPRLISKHMSVVLFQHF